ncbi:Protein CBG19192 [Caenorhabditis briggsae]|uniref:Protein CBG19192 n=1 Tax=Caenorhabditis briggsae TaxID=6238 RepID=A8XV17_CAEBR|nr:Protein CBG19192 [Caenorhabditis briggsae]CAP36484.1 Protein CBG19192 [Caenorhabditis briggsae]
MKFEKAEEKNKKKIAEGILNDAHSELALSIMTLPLLVALVGLTSLIIYIGVIIRKALDANKVTVKSTYFVVFSSPPSDFLWPIRFILSVFILFWRIIILARPQFAKSCSPKIACSTILILSLAFSITDVLVFFLGCLVQLTAHPGCMALGCMAGPCFAHYATINRTILFSLTFLCVFIHSILICFYEIKETGEKRIEKVRF